MLSYFLKLGFGKEEKSTLGISEGISYRESITQIWSRLKEQKGIPVQSKYNDCRKYLDHQGQMEVGSAGQQGREPRARIDLQLQHPLRRVIEPGLCG